jgi:hypothetical protein
LSLISYVYVTEMIYNIFNDLYLLIWNQNRWIRWTLVAKSSRNSTELGEIDIITQLLLCYRYFLFSQLDIVRKAHRFSYLIYSKRNGICDLWCAATQYKSSSDHIKIREKLILKKCTLRSAEATQFRMGAKEM